MKNYTFIKAHLVEPSEYAKSQGYKVGSLIGSYIYKTDSHALALHQCGKDCPGYGDAVVLEAMTIDVDDEKNKALYKAHEECGCFPFFVWVVIDSSPKQRKENIMKKQRFEIWINGHYLESFKTLEMAQARVKTYERIDRYERDVEGYTNPLPTYEIKAA